MAVGGVIQGILTVISILPTLVEMGTTVIKVLEKDSPSGGGEAQKAAFVGMVDASLKAADRFAEDGEMLDQSTKDAIIDVSGDVVDLIVGMYNTIGVFKHGAKE